jgi:hypothetical protein
MAASNTVTTLAGSPNMPGIVDGVGSAARFFLPGQITVDDSDIVYVLDGSNLPSIGEGLVRRLDPCSGQVTTIAGTLGKNGVTVGPLPGTFNNTSGIVAVPGLGLVVSDSAENALLWLH